MSGFGNESFLIPRPLYFIALFCYFYFIFFENINNNDDLFMNYNIQNKIHINFKICILLYKLIGKN